MAMRDYFSRAYFGRCISLVVIKMTNNFMNKCKHCGEGVEDPGHHFSLGSYTHVFEPKSTSFMDKIRNILHEYCESDLKMFFDVSMSSEQYEKRYYEALNETSVALQQLIAEEIIGEDEPEIDAGILFRNEHRAEQRRKLGLK